MTIKITMFSSAQKVAGQGVGSAYSELIRLLKTYLKTDFELHFNDYHATDISHYHTIDPQFYLSTFSKKRGRKIGYVHFLPETLQGSLKIPHFLNPLVAKYVIGFYKRMDQLVVVNPSFIPQLQSYGLDSKKIKYIPNFVSQKEFYPCSQRQRAHIRQDLGLKDNDFVVFGDGQVQKRKGIDDFYKLAQHNPHIKFIWAGGFSFGALTDGYDHYKQLIKTAPVNMMFTGIISRDKLNDYLNAADLFLLPSFDELFPMSVLEAFNTHTPVLLRDLELYHNIIQGYYQPADNYADMNQIIRHLASNPADLQQLALMAASGANYYSEQHLSQIWKEFYWQQYKQKKR
ncbi:glycosyltransferase family 4 protein [Bombilactobacillus bombi]|uniref:glycosyltransferase family 4 protein n=1 Tax=Bombilactobacillus bombi TaxID=1303590 RepID=UPI0015E5D861|nr:glycosyltransferase family 4 protein [Bombilactobacillus bombi]MBA1434903.1 glycosyltransferase [Bombilactobacillus bombi]